MRRCTAVEIDLAAIKHNYGLIGALTNHRRVIATVKADAYGHGAVEVASALEELGVYCLGVAYAEEAIGLRRAGILKTPILVYFDKLDPADIFKYDLTPVVYGPGSADMISDEALKQNRRIDVHVDIDTGMGRVGFLHDRDMEGIKALSRLKGLKVAGFMSHFSEADLKDRSFAELQMQRYLHMRQELSTLFEDAIWHMANSAAVMSYPESHLDAVRPGLIIYGADCLEPGCRPHTASTPFMPVMTVKSRLLDIRRMPPGRSISYGRTFVTRRDSIIGVVATGYADGYPRAMSNKAHVLVNGQFAPIVGRICMDVAMVDLTECTDDIAQGCEVVLMGRQGDMTITASELATWAGTISYEILISLGRVNDREYRV